jgi:hypothetical protein
MALIELDAPVGETTGYLGLWAAPNEALRPAILESAGYPGDKRKQLGADHMWGVLGEVRRVTAHEIYLGNRFDTWNGQSGSGLWIDESEQGGGIFVVGVFAYGSPRSYNSGTRLNRFRYAYVTAWIDGYEAPADVTVESVASTLPARAEVLSQGSVDVRVANLGGSPAAFPVTLRLERRAADPLLLGATIVDLAAGASTVASFPVSIPEGLGDRAARFVAQLNEDLDVAESDETNNVGSSAGFQILPAPTALVAGPWTSRRIVAGELVRYEVPVPDGMRRLRFELRGARCRATALDPLGAEVSFRTGRTLSPPIAGTWTLLVENQSRRARRVTVRARVR